MEIETINSTEKRMPKRKFKISLKECLDELKNANASLVFVVIISFFIMVLAALIFFFSFVRGAEKVMVPNVVGKNLTTALLEMQEKELYAKIQLKFSDLPGDKGNILAQDPKPGSIVKAYRRINLTVSRGVMLDFMNDYTGKNIDEVRSSLEFIFGSNDSGIKIAPTVYKMDDSQPGTILAQFPAEGTQLADKISIQFIVSSGKELKTYEIPKVEGLSIKQFLSKLDGTKMIFDFELMEAEKCSADGIIMSQDKIKEKAEAYTRINTTLTIRPKDEKAENVQGLFETELPDYPYPVPMVFEAKSLTGRETTLAEFNHTGKKVTLPYDVKKGTTLVLYVANKEVAKKTVE